MATQYLKYREENILLALGLLAAGFALLAYEEAKDARRDARTVYNAIYDHRSGLEDSPDDEDDDGPDR